MLGHPARACALARIAPSSIHQSAPPPGAGSFFSSHSAPSDVCVSNFKYGAVQDNGIKRPPASRARKPSEGKPLGKDPRGKLLPFSTAGMLAKGQTLAIDNQSAAHDRRRLSSCACDQITSIEDGTAYVYNLFITLINGRRAYQGPVLGRGQGKGVLCCRLHASAAPEPPIL